MRKISKESQQASCSSNTSVSVTVNCTLTAHDFHFTLFLNES